MKLCRYSKNEKIVEMAEMLLDNGIEVNQSNDFGDTALHILLFWNPSSDKIIQIAELLIAKGIDVNQKDKYGRSAADYLNRRNETVVS